MAGKAKNIVNAPTAANEAAAANDAAMTQIREQRDAREKVADGLKLVIDGATLKCDLCTAPQGTLKVNFDTPSTQEKKTATIEEKDATSLIFTGNCTKSPNSASPCAVVMQLAQWKKTGTLKVQDRDPLLQRSTIPCTYGGVDVCITDSGQVSEPNAIKAAGAPVPDPNDGPYYYGLDGRFLGRGSVIKKNDVRLARPGKTKSGNESFTPINLQNAIIEDFIVLLDSHDDFLQIASIVRQETGDSNNITGQMVDEAKFIAYSFFNAAGNKKDNYLKKITGGESSVGKSSGSQDNVYGEENNTPVVLAARAGVIYALAGGIDPVSGGTQFDGGDFLAWGLTQGPWGGGKHAKFREYTRVIIPQNILDTHIANLRLLYPSGKVSWKKYKINGISIVEEVFTNQNNFSGGAFNYETSASSRVNKLTGVAAKGGSIFWKVEFDLEAKEKRDAIAAEKRAKTKEKTKAPAKKKK